MQPLSRGPRSDGIDPPASRLDRGFFALFGLRLRHKYGPASLSRSLNAVAQRDKGAGDNRYGANYSERSRPEHHEGSVQDCAAGNKPSAVGRVGLCLSVRKQILGPGATLSDGPRVGFRRVNSHGRGQVRLRYGTPANQPQATSAAAPTTPPARPTAMLTSDPPKPRTEPWPVSTRTSSTARNTAKITSDRIRPKRRLSTLARAGEGRYHNGDPRLAGGVYGSHNRSRGRSLARSSDQERWINGVPIPVTSRQVSNSRWSRRSGDAQFGHVTQVSDSRSGAS